MVWYGNFLFDYEISVTCKSTIIIIVNNTINSNVNV